MKWKKFCTDSVYCFLPFCTECPTLWPDPCSVQTETAACPSFSQGHTALSAVSVCGHPAKLSVKETSEMKRWSMKMRFVTIYVYTGHTTEYYCSAY